MGTRLTEDDLALIEWRPTREGIGTYGKVPYELNEIAPQRVRDRLRAFRSAGKRK